MTKFVLTLKSNRGEQTTAKLTTDLLRDLRNSQSVTVEVVSSQTPTSGRAVDPGMLGQLMVTFLTSGAAVALINSLRPIFERAPNTVIKVAKATGDSIEVTTNDVSNEGLAHLIDRLTRMDRSKPTK
jgi:hypothetical protein